MTLVGEERDEKNMALCPARLGRRGYRLPPGFSCLVGTKHPLGRVARRLILVGLSLPVNDSPGLYTGTAWGAGNVEATSRFV
jgi:hypothetical protein